MAKKQILLGGERDSLAMPRTFFSNTDKFSITAVHDGYEALRNLAEKKPDLAILDVNLARKGGDECCKDVKLGGLSPATSVVLMVCMQNQGDIRRCLNANCDALLVKPLAYEQLSGIATRLLFREKHPTSRFEVHLPTSYGIHPHQLAFTYAADLSTGGIFLETPHFVPVDTLLNVTFTLPNDGTTVKCTARVAWLNGPALLREPLLPSGMGLQFVDIDHREIDAIREFLHSEERVH